MHFSHKFRSKLWDKGLNEHPSQLRSFPMETRWDPEHYIISTPEHGKPNPEIKHKCCNDALKNISNPGDRLCLKSVCVRSYSSPYFLAFRLNTERIRWRRVFTFKALGSLEINNCFTAYTQLTFTCSKLKIETLEKGVKYVQS